MSRQDSIVHESVATVGHDIVPYGRPLTPAHVLRRLPPDATPSQQDSAIQAVFTPGEVHYSNRPDTLHLPCHDAGRSIFDVSLPVYYEENYFSGDSLLHPEIKGGRHGVSGDPVPYTMRDDDIITGLLLLCFILVVVALSNSRRFIVRQLKDFLYVPHSGISAITETTSEVRFQFFLVLQTSHQLYMFVNPVLLDYKKNLQWMKSALFITSTEGVLLLPVVLLQVYFDLEIQSVVIYFIVVLILVKILTFYKCYFIFFRKAGVILQIILYFCALEIVPIAALWGALVITGNHLKINI